METRAQELRAAAMRERENPARTTRPTYIPPGMEEFIESLREKMNWSESAVYAAVAQAVADKTGQSGIMAMWAGWQLARATLPIPRLIAAAPELLAACHAIVDLASREQWPMSYLVVVAQARAAIARAT